MEEGKAYIESGILELYVLGELNAQEQSEVEAMAAKYPEIKKEITAIELAMEQYAMQNAIAPPEELKDKILGKIGNTTILPLHPGGYETKIRNLRIALVACIAFVVISAVALYASRQELSTAKEQIIALNRDKEKFATTVNYMTEANKDLQTIADMTADPNWKTVHLAGTKMDPQAKMTVYWHTSGRHVMLDNSKMNLPKNDEAHQYQLWALVKGKPVDLGVFDVNGDNSQILLKMKEIAGADAFAVTLEKRGGSAGPTMDQMIAMGAV